MKFRVGEKVRVKNFEDLKSPLKCGNDYLGISKETEFENKILEISIVDNYSETVKLSNGDFMIETSCLIKLNKINLRNDLFEL